MIIKFFMSMIILLSSVFSFTLFKDMKKHKKQWERNVNASISFFMGFVANFLDVLGVGSFAVTIAFNRVFKQVPDKLLIGTLFVGVGSLPLAISTIFMIHTIEVDVFLLMAVTIALSVGNILGVKLISTLSEQKIRSSVGFILIIVGLLLIQKVSSSDSSNLSQATSLSPSLFAVGVLGSFVIGVIQAFGLGSFAPILALFSMLGLGVKSIYPLMFMGACFSVMLGAFEYIKQDLYSRKASVFICLGGVFGVILALKLLISLDTKMLNVMVSIILIFIGLEMLIKSFSSYKKN